jgi:hypothetical protein
MVRFLMTIALLGFAFGTAAGCAFGVVASGFH